MRGRRNLSTSLDKLTSKSNTGRKGYRKLVKELYLDGWSAEEIQDEMGIKKDTIDMVIKRIEAKNDN